MQLTSSSLGLIKKWLLRVLFTALHRVIYITQSRQLLDVQCVPWGTTDYYVVQCLLASCLAIGVGYSVLFIVANEVTAQEITHLISANILLA